jgi:hypothetical protein
MGGLVARLRSICRFAGKKNGLCIDAAVWGEIAIMADASDDERMFVGPMPF